MAKVSIGKVTASKKAWKKKSGKMKMQRITAKQRKARQINILKAQEAARRKRHRKTSAQIKQNTARIALRSMFK